MLKRSLHTLWLLLVLLLVLAATALTAARWWVPEASAYREEIEHNASKMLGKQVSIERMEASWRGLNPVIRLMNVQLSDPAGDAATLRAREVRLTIDAEQYLSQGRLRLAGIGVIGADFTLVRDTGGSVYLEGFRPEKDSTLLAELLQMALSVRDVNVTFIDRQTAAAPRRFSSVSMSLRSQGDSHSLTGHLLLPVELGYRADVEALLQGDSARVQDWRGTVYIKGQSMALAGVLGPLLTDEQIVEGVADLRLWLNLGGGKLHSVKGEIDTESLKITQQGEAGDYSFEADTLRAAFGWRAWANGWQFAVQNLLVAQQQRRWETENLSLAGSQQDGARNISGVSPLVVLDGVGALLPIIPGLSVEQRIFLGGLQPRGLIKDLRFDISSGPQGTRVNDFSACFTGLSIEQSGPLPKLTRLDGALHGTTESGLLTLASYNTGLYDDRVFREAVLLDTVKGDISWQVHNNSLEIATNGLFVRNSDLTLNLKAGLLLGDAHAPVLNLSVAVIHFDVGHTHAYLPAQIMSPKGVAWLDRSLQQGTVTDGQVVVNGPLDKLPFDNDEGILEVRLPVTDAILDYNTAWTPVTGLDAMVNFTGRQMDIDSSRGAIRSAQLVGVHAQIKDIASPVLTLKGNVQGAMPVMLAELGSSPLGKTYGGFVDRVTTSGDASLGLDLVVPLNKAGAPVTVAGEIAMNNNGLKVNDADVELTKISGLLNFDDKGIVGEDLQVRLYDRPARARVWTDREKRVTRIALDGRLDLFNRFIDKQSLLGAVTSGDSDWHVQVAIRGMPQRGKRADIGVEVSSNLAGTTIDLPAPFGKPRASKRALSVVVDRVDTKAKTLRVRYGGLVSGRLVIVPDAQRYELKKGVISIGGGDAALPAADKLLFTGNVGIFSLSIWQPYFDKGSGGGVLPLEFTLELGDTEILGYKLGSLSAQAKSAGRDWSIKVDGAALAGAVELRRTDAGLDKMVVDLQRLALDTTTRDSVAAASQSAAAAPASFPDLQVKVQQLQWDGFDLGLLEIEAGKQDNGVYSINKATLASDILTAQLTGSWREGRKETISSVDLAITQGTMDQLMELFGYQKNIDGGTLSGSMRLAWPGPPWSFAPAGAEGKIDIAIKEGQLLDLEPGATGRVLGLISLNNLPRRLSLDFSDLFAEGFSFDKISGGFVLDDSNAYTNDLLVDGPAAKIEISGRIGLADEDYDELVTVIPYVKTGLPLAGTLAGGPAVGAVLLVAETLLEDRLGPLNRIGKKQYSVTGPWEAPVIEQLRSSSDDADTGLSVDFE